MGKGGSERERGSGERKGGGREGVDVERAFMYTETGSFSGGRKCPFT